MVQLSETGISRIWRPMVIYSGVYTFFVRICKNPHHHVDDGQGKYILNETRCKQVLPWNFSADKAFQFMMFAAYFLFVAG